jgi:polynucleotide 5'-hydroxyl-kinase GRC3/NOL9
VKNWSLHLPTSWEKAAQTILKNKGLVFIIGPTDSGKTTFAHYLIEEARKANLKVGLVDSDIGQSTLGPPGTVGFASIKTSPPGTAESIYFVGDVSPKGHFIELIFGTERMVRNAQEAGCELIIVDTCGLVSFPHGYKLKYHKIQLLKPNFVVALGGSGGLEIILKNLPSLTSSLVLPSSKAACQLSLETRRERRRKSFQKYFRNAQNFSWELSQLKFHPPDFLSQPKQLNRLVGLANNEGEFQAVGTVVEVNKTKDEIIIAAPINKPEDIKIVSAGSLLVSLEGEELGRFYPAS